jgi:hypothetical protein
MSAVGRFSKSRQFIDNLVGVTETLHLFVSGYFDKSSKYSIPTEILGKVIVYNVTTKKSDSKVEVLEHSDLLKLAQEIPI